MTGTREQVLSALFTKLSTATQEDGITPAFVSASRRFKLWTEVPSSEQPAIFVLDGNEMRNQQPPQGLPSKLYIRCTVVVYVNTGDPEAIPSIDLNNALDAIDRAMAPDNFDRNVFTLGGLAYWCWIEGQIPKVPGDLDGQGMAALPVHILLP